MPAGPGFRGAAALEAHNPAALEARGLTALRPAATTTAILERSAALFGERPAIAFLPGGHPDDVPERMTHAALLADALRFAAALERLDLPQARGVALLLPPRPETFVAMLGAQVVGHACPLNPMLGVDHLEALLVAAEVGVLVALGPDADYPGIWPKASELQRRRPSLRLLRVGGPGAMPDAAEFGALLAAAGAAPGRRPRPEDLAACFHTGGTTGAPKLVRHTHANQAHAAYMLGLGYGLGPDDVVLNGFPLFHVAGAICHGLAEIAAGASILLPSQTGMRNLVFVRNHWRVVARHRVSILTGGPTFLTTLLSQDLGDADIGSARVLVTGGSPLPPSLAEAFEARFGVPVRALFGMTEACGVLSLEPLAAPRVPLSCGWPIPFCEVRAVRLLADGLADAQARALPPGETGVLLVRGPQVSPGYTDPALADGTRLPGDWLVTGDLGHLDAEGRVFVTGRAKDVIIRSGHNLDPAAIEEAFLSHPEVELCAAVGLPDAYAGELPMIFVKRRPGSAIGADALLAAVSDRIPERAAVPKRVEFVAELSLTATGKVFKPELRRRAAEFALRDAVPEASEVEAVITPQGVAVEVRLRGQAGLAPALRARIAAYRLPVTLVEEPEP